MINLPAGTPVKTAIDVATVDFVALIGELQKKAFNGYVSIAVMGAGGIEEGTLVFDEGKIAASIYEYYKYNKLLQGELAFPRVLNASGAKKGVIDLFQLTAQQVQLFLAFNENSIFVPAEKDLKTLKVSEFSPFFEEQVKEEEKRDTKSDVIKKLKLEDLKKEEERISEELEAVQSTSGTSEEEDLLGDLQKTQ
jgi:hypothetical protein